MKDAAKTNETIIYSFEEAIELLRVGVVKFSFRNARGQNAKVNVDSNCQKFITTEDVA